MSDAQYYEVNAVDYGMRAEECILLGDATSAGDAARWATHFALLCVEEYETGQA